MPLDATITEFYAAEDVPGSQLLVDLGPLGRVLIDMGLRYKQGEMDDPLPFDASSVDFVVATHGHADHIGQLLRLPENGFKGGILGTHLTDEIAIEQLKQAVSAPFIHNKWAKGKRYQYGPMKGQWIPFQKVKYTGKDVENIKSLFLGVDGKMGIPYRRPFDLSDRIRVTLYDGGHIPGSSQVCLEVKGDSGKTTKLLFAFDLGRTDYRDATRSVADIPIVRYPDADLPKDIDYYITEATYGDKAHKNLDESIGVLEDCVNQAYRQGGILITPAFGIMRSHMLWCFNYRFHKEGKVPDGMLLHSSNPGAFQIAKLFNKYIGDYDERTQAEFKDPQDNPFKNQWMVHHKSMDQTLEQLKSADPYWISASSGMGDRGRIVTILRHKLSDPKAIVLRTGYAAKGTTMDQIDRGERRIRFDAYGPPVEMKAGYNVMGGLSGHADYIEHLAHVKNVKDPQEGEQFKGIFIKHGEKSACYKLQEKFIDAGFDADKVHVLKPKEPMRIRIE
jgi:metallo-beta-lactamase family protein